MDMRNQALITAIGQDLKFWRDWSGARDIISLHFGGGTPSLLQATDLEHFITRIDQLWGLDEDCEIAIEANPQDADRGLWADYRDIGINRLSLGVQSFNDAALKQLGRGHDAAASHHALEMAQKLFSRVSADIIYGWAGQDMAALKADIKAVLAHDLGHISAYQLTIEAGTAFAKAQARGIDQAVGNDESAGFYEQVQACLMQAGYEHYEVSNFAQPNQRSMHNQSYWLGYDYVGAGPGAHGRLNASGQRFATIAQAKPQIYQAQIREKGHGLSDRTALSAQEQGEEYVMMGLRLDHGIGLGRYKALTGQDLPSPIIDSLIEQGLLDLHASQLRATPQGWMVLNRITELLLT